MFNRTLCVNSDFLLVQLDQSTILLFAPKRNAVAVFYKLTAIDLRKLVRSIVGN